LIEKALLALVAGAAVATATAVSVVALALALYLGLSGPFGGAGAAAATAVLFALIIALAALLASNIGKKKGGDGHEHDHALTDKLIGIVKERPLVSVIAAIAAGILAIRNPALVGVILTAFIDRKNQNEGKR